MVARTLRSVFPGAVIDRYYEALFAEFGDWNARYWEQRAINAKLEGKWGPAESWASRAVTLKDDPYTRTTFGTILLNKAAVLVEYGDATWMDLYRRGKDELDAALQMDAGNRVAAVSFLENTLQLIRTALTASPGLASSEELAVIRADWTMGYANVQLVGSIEDSARRRATELRRAFDAIDMQLADDRTAPPAGRSNTTAASGRARGSRLRNNGRAGGQGGDATRRRGDQEGAQRRRQDHDDITRRRGDDEGAQRRRENQRDTARRRRNDEGAAPRRGQREENTQGPGNDGETAQQRGDQKGAPRRDRHHGNQVRSARSRHNDDAARSRGNQGGATRPRGNDSETPRRGGQPE